MACGRLLANKTDLHRQLVVTQKVRGLKHAHLASLSRGRDKGVASYSVSSERGSRRKGMMPMKVMPFSSRQGRKGRRIRDLAPFFDF